MFLALPIALTLLASPFPAPQASLSQPPAGPVQVLASPDNGQRITVSVLDMEEARSLFAELAGREDIPHGFLLDGNYARAHKMVRILDDKGVTAAKAWVIGDLYLDTKRFGEVGLTYHVAPVVFIQAGKTTALYLLDPSLFSEPVPHATWKAKLLAKPKAKLVRAYFTTRFAYDPDDRTKALDGYEEEPLLDMNSTNRDFSRKLFMFDRLKSPSPH